MGSFEGLGCGDVVHATEHDGDDGAGAAVTAPTVDVEALAGADPTDEVVDEAVEDRVGRDRAVDDGKVDEIHLRVGDVAPVRGHEAADVVHVGSRGAAGTPSALGDVRRNLALEAHESVESVIAHEEEEELVVLLVVDAGGVAARHHLTLDDPVAIRGWADVAYEVLDRHRRGRVSPSRETPENAPRCAPSRRRLTYGI